MEAPMRLALITSILIGAPVALAGDGDCDFTALQKPISVLSKPVSALKGDPRVCDTVPPPTHSVWRSIQGPLDRSYGRIVDQASFEVSGIERSHRGYVRAFDELWIERERQLRLDERRRLDGLDERDRRIELDRREYLVYLRAGVSPMARQAETDRRALELAAVERDRALAEASEALNRGLVQKGADRAALKRDYDRSRQQIREQYEQTRARILGD
jgi:hypothetical protein